MKYRPVPLRRSHDWRPVEAPAGRLMTKCLACDEKTIFVVKADGSTLKLSGPVSSQCAGKVSTTLPRATVTR
jgi:hypothetical protein